MNNSAALVRLDNSGVSEFGKEKPVLTFAARFIMFGKENCVLFYKYSDICTR